jgi:SP family facilitated glucose transporter-like MFS transporter 1
MSSGLSEETAKFMTIGIGAIMVVMTLVIMPLMDRMGRRTLHLYGLGGMFIFSIFITISFLIKVRNHTFISECKGFGRWMTL